VSAESNGGGFEPEPRSGAGLEKEQRDRAAEQLLTRRKTGLEIIRCLAKVIDVVDGKVARAQKMPNPARTQPFTRALMKSRRRN
jgi:hypothetical protein